METTFKYNGKVITTPNLEKKLKRMKISINDIEIIDNLIKKEEKKSELDLFYSDKIKVIVRSTEDNIRRICFIHKDRPRPTIRELFKNQMWDPETKTGIKYLTEEFLMTMYYEN